MDWTLEFYIDERDRSPVEEFFDRLPCTDLARIQHSLELLGQFGIKLGPPHVKPLERKLWELRVPAGGKSYRVIYFAHTGRRFILLHAFLKKTRKTPRPELAIARKRLTGFLETEGDL